MSWCSHGRPDPVFPVQVWTPGLWPLPSSSLSSCCCSALSAAAAAPAPQMPETGGCEGPLSAKSHPFGAFMPLFLHRAAVPDDDVVARMKHHVQGVLANLSAMLPCFSLGGYKLPKVTGEESGAADGPFWGESHRAGDALRPHDLSLLFSPPQFPTMTQKSPSTPASSSRPRPPGFRIAPSPPSTPTTRDPSTQSLPEKVTHEAAPPLPAAFPCCPNPVPPFWSPWAPRGCWAQPAIYFYSLTSLSPRPCLVSCTGTCPAWAQPYYSRVPGLTPEP